MTAKAWLLALATAALTHAALLYAPHGYTIAPLIAGILAGAILASRPLHAATAGLAAGAAGYALTVLASNARQALPLALAIGGPAPIAIALLYHAAATALTATLASQARHQEG